MTPTLLPVADGRQIRHYLASALRGRRPLLSAVLAVLVADSALGLAAPIAIGRLTQAVADRQGGHALIGPVLLLGVASLAATVTGAAATVLLARVTLPLVAGLREQAMATALELPIDAVEAGGTGDLVSRVSGDAERVADVASGALEGFLTAALAILAALAGLAGLDWRFAAAGLLAVPIQAWTLRWYLRASRPIYAAGRTADGRRAAALLTGFTALPTLRALRLGPQQRDRIAAASGESMDYEVRATRVATRFFGRLNVAELVGLSAILLVAFVLVRQGVASIGAATTAALFFAGLFNPINMVLGVFDTVQQAAAGLARLIGITTVRLVAEPSAAGFDGGELTVTDVCFAYGDGPDVLHDVNLTLEPGRHLAIVGTTGSGKSTLATLIAGLRAPRAGTITRAGSTRTALVTQETHVFAGTVEDNVRLGRPDASREAVMAALDAVGAGALAPETRVGAGGLPLTASQAQQLALARVLLLDPEIVILDEATAEAGSDAARALDHAAAKVLDGRTAVVIAHRLSQAAVADIVLVMESGRVIERGTHDDLSTSGGVYSGLWAAWAVRGTGDPA